MDVGPVEAEVQPTPRLLAVRMLGEAHQLPLGSDTEEIRHELPHVVAACGIHGEFDDFWSLGPCGRWRGLRFGVGIDPRPLEIFGPGGGNRLADGGDGPLGFDGAAAGDQECTKQGRPTHLRYCILKDRVGKRNPADPQWAEASAARGELELRRTSFAFDDFSGAKDGPGSDV